MSPEPNTENTNAATEAVSQEDAELKEMVTFADNFAATTRDKKNTTLVLLTTSPEDIATLKAFVRRVNVQQKAARQIYQLSVAAAQKRNEGKTVPPSKQRKAKATPAS